MILMLLYTILVLFILLGILIIRRIWRIPPSYRYMVYVVLILFLFSISLVWKSIGVAKHVVSTYDGVIKQREQVIKQIENLGNEITKEFSYSDNDKYVLWKKGTLSELYTFKVVDVLRATRHPYEKVSFATKPKHIIADLSARSIKITPQQFNRPPEFIRYTGALSEYFVINDMKIQRTTIEDKKTGASYTYYKVNYTVTQWEWGNAQTVSNPDVYLFIINDLGHKELLTKGKFLDLYRGLDRSKAYFVQRVIDVENANIISKFNTTGK